MEALLAYGQGLGFGFTLLTTPSDGAMNVSFATTTETKLLVLRVESSNPTVIRIGYSTNAHSSITDFGFGNTASSVADARTAILNFYNSQ
jgi:hypothetical protein